MVGQRGHFAKRLLECPVLLGRPIKHGNHPTQCRVTSAEILFVNRNGQIEIDRVKEVVVHQPKDEGLISLFFGSYITIQGPNNSK